MSGSDATTLTRSGLIDYLRAGATPRDRWQVGMELERMGRLPDGRPLPYQDDGGPSIRALIERYGSVRGGAPVMEGRNPIGLDGDWGTISLEPGGQFEWSSKPQATLGRLERELDEHERVMREMAEQFGIDWLDVAVEPELAVDAMIWMPKARYAIMRPFLGERGRLAHRMMTQTAAIQCAYDYEDERDWRRKVRAAALLSPLATALFANSSRVDGADSGYRTYRQAIWRETDPERCGLPDVVFERDFGFERWLDWVLDVPTIFRHRARGLVPTGGVPFRELMRETGCDAVKPEDWETHESTIFTDVRAYTYIEIRSADLQPAGQTFAVPALWTGLLYHEPSLEAALELAEAYATPERWRAAMDEAARHGLDGRVDGSPLRETTARFVRAAIDGLEAGTACVDDPGAAVRHIEQLCRRVALDP